MSIPMLDGPTIPQAQGAAPEQLVVLLHGYGADGNDLIGLADPWRALLPTAVFASPHAPERCGMNPVGYQWFGLSNLGPAELWDGVRRAAPALDAYLDRMLGHYDLTADKLALVGFSQGTMMGLHVGLRRPAAPACILGYSGALAGAEHLPTEKTVEPPIMLVHGDADPVVPVDALHAAVGGLGAAGLSAEWHVRPQLPHGIDPTGVELGGAFLRRWLVG